FMFILILLSGNSVFANTLINNPITNGAKKMLQDASTVLMTLATLAAPVCIGFFQFKKKFSDDEMEGKQYDKKTKAVIVAYIIIMSASVIISIVSNYFKTGGTSV
ncbi:MAG: hypothetical protein K2F59_03350, partial [Eubacteriales bacterium]|nr:hypothetical protein [Eubacteriales bacterium]